MAPVLLPGHAAYIWTGYANCANYPPVLKERKLYFSQGTVWTKQHPVPTSTDRTSGPVERVRFASEQRNLPRP